MTDTEAIFMLRTAIEEMVQAGFSELAIRDTTERILARTFPPRWLDDNGCIVQRKESE